jgi:hypothetical protein
MPVAELRKRRQDRQHLAAQGRQKEGQRNLDAGRLGKQRNLFAARRGTTRRAQVARRNDINRPPRHTTSGGQDRL